MLSFANPWFLFLLPLAAGPLLLHLLSLRKMRRTDFSSLFFLRRMRERRFRWLKLRDILLLLMRTLFIALLVLALAGPSWQGRLPFGRIKADLVLIIDDSYSTAARFENLKETALRLLGQLSGGSRVLVLTASGYRSDVLWDEPELSRKIVTGLHPSRSGRDLSAAWRTALEALAESSSTNKRIILVSDGQKRALEFLKTERMPGGVEVFAFLDYENPPENTSITNLELYPAFPVGDEEQILTARLERNGKKKRVNIGLWTDERLAGEREVELASGSRDVKFSLSPGARDVRVVVDGDSIPADDERFALAGAGKNVRVALVGGPDSDMLSLALQAGGEIEVVSVSSGMAGSLSPESYNLLIWDGAVDLPVQAQASVRKGLPVFILLDASALDLPGASKAVEVSSTEGFEVPAASALFQDIEEADIDAIRFKRYVKLETTRGEVILSLKNGAPLLWKDSGVFYLTTRLTPEYTDAVYRAVFPGFVQRMILYTVGASARKEYLIGDTLRLPVATGEPFYVETPALSYEISPRFSEQGYGVEFKTTSEPGFYRLGSRVFVVNPDPVETSLSRLGAGELQKHGIRAYPLDASLPHKLQLDILILAAVFLAAEFIFIFI